MRGKSPHHEKALQLETGQKIVKPFDAVHLALWQRIISRDTYMHRDRVGFPKSYFDFTSLLPYHVAFAFAFAFVARLLPSVIVIRTPQFLPAKVLSERGSCSIDSRLASQPSSRGHVNDQFMRQEASNATYLMWLGSDPTRSSSYNSSRWTELGLQHKGRR